MKKDFTQSIKIIILSLIIGLGVSVVYALDWTAPLGAPPGNNTAAPINVGNSDQVKAGGLAIGSTVLPGSGQIYTAAGGLHKGLTSFIRADNSNPALEVGDSGTGLYPRVQIDRFRSTANNTATWGVNNTCAGVGATCVTYPAPVCADSSGYLILCPGPGAATVDLTVDTPTIATSEVTTISQAVNLTWTTTNLVGATCTGTENNSATGFTATPSYAGGTDGAVIEHFGVTTFTISCTPSGGGTAVTDTATVTSTGYKSYTSGTTFTPLSTDFNSGTVFTIRAQGGGGGGASYGGSVCPGGDCTSLDGGSGTSTTVTKGATILTATAGTGGYYNNDVHNGASDAVAGTAGSGSSGHNAGYNYWGTYISNQSCGGGALPIAYGAGGSPGCSATGNSFGGAGGSQSTTNTWTSGAYTYSLGSGGIHGGLAGSIGGLGQDGGKGAVRFEW